ncbi:hypothetical protein AVEN_151070-1 [Araneus ventricosus]|uniref:Uncharacterized protein n=1 Tax=Araneus ventricosus TaxID=182803 RepID=A0A4Y2TIK4_ARAVE|nr:hypothetical protein AVEN_253079-1 [Araneus ventricosus]GBN99286.1 hypothetical protein AVEN_151070-1 [Araneus ventricosus]
MLFKEYSRWYYSMQSYQGRNGLMVRSQLHGPRVPGSKPDSTEDPPCIVPVVVKSDMVCQTSSPLEVAVEAWLGDGGTDSGVVLVIRLRFKIKWSFPK